MDADVWWFVLSELDDFYEHAWGWAYQDTVGGVGKGKRWVQFNASLCKLIISIDHLSDNGRPDCWGVSKCLWKTSVKCPES